MTTLLKSALKATAVAGLVLSVAQPALAKPKAEPAAAPVAAPASSGPLVPGLAVANLDAVVANSTASQTAAQQRPVTYKAQIDQYQARGTAVQNQLKPMIDKFNKDRAAPNANQAALQQQAASIQQIQQSAEQEMNQIVQPVAYSEAYVTEQIEGKLDAAVKAAMAKRNISILLAPQAIVALNNNAYNLNQDILEALNAALPSAQLVPPAGWEPRQIREARAQQQAQQGGAPAAPAGAPTAPRPAAGPQPEGR
jgi:Skp family chaperone for outer membrane proteins